MDKVDHTPRTLLRTHLHTHTHTLHAHCPHDMHTSGRQKHTCLHCTHLKRSPDVAHICAIAMIGLAVAVAMLAHGQARAAAIRRGESPHSATITRAKGRVCIHE